MTSSIDNIFKIRRRHASFMPLRKRAASSRALSRLLPAVFDTELTNCRPEAHPPNSDEVCSIILLISITLHLVRLLAGIAECSHMALRFLNLSKSVILLFSQICALYHTFCYLANYVHHATLSGNRCTISITYFSSALWPGHRKKVPAGHEALRHIIVLQFYQLIIDPAGTSRSVVSSDSLPSGSSAQSSIP